MIKKDKKIKVVYRPVEKIDESRLDAVFDFIICKAIEEHRKQNNT